VVVYHPCVFPHSVRFECPALCGDAVDVHRAVAALRRDVLVERIPRDTLHVVGMFGDFVYAFAWVERGETESVELTGRADKPSIAVYTLAQLSVLPARIYSPEGLQAKSYTCIVVHLTEHTQGRGKDVRHDQGGMKAVTGK
jgi:hypothetical protein